MFHFYRTYAPSIHSVLMILNLCTDLLLDSLELCKYTLAAKEIYRQCQIENYGFTAKVFSPNLSILF